MTFSRHVEPGGDGLGLVEELDEAGLLQLGDVLQDERQLGLRGRGELLVAHPPLDMRSKISIRRFGQNRTLSLSLLHPFYQNNKYQ